MCSRGGRALTAVHGRDPEVRGLANTVLHESLILPCDRIRSQLTARCVRMPQAFNCTRAPLEIDGVQEARPTLRRWEAWPRKRMFGSELHLHRARCVALIGLIVHASHRTVA